MDKKLGRKKVKKMLKMTGIKVSNVTLDELAERNEGERDIVAFMVGYLSQESPLYRLGATEGRLQPYR